MRFNNLRLSWIATWASSCSGRRRTRTWPACPCLPSPSGLPVVSWRTLTSAQYHRIKSDSSLKLTEKLEPENGARELQISVERNQKSWKAEDMTKTKTPADRRRRTSDQQQGKMAQNCDVIGQKWAKGERDRWQKRWEQVGKHRERKETDVRRGGNCAFYQSISTTSSMDLYEIYAPNYRIKEVARSK